jgi:hypothetical protein
MIRVAPLAIFGLLAIGPQAIQAAALPLSADDRTLLATYARDTWRSLDASTSSGQLPADGLWRNGETWTPTLYTSPTNIAAYLWSTIAAEGLGLIDHEESGKRLGKMMASVGRLERSHGFYYNWYDPRTGARLRTWPGGGPLRGFLSTVDNGWLAASLMMVGRARPELKSQADALLAPMNFKFFYDPHDPLNPVAHPGLLRGGYWTDGGGAFADFHYGVLNTEPRIASYIGIARGDLPPDHYYRMSRSAPDPAAPSRTFHGIQVSEGAMPYRGLRVVPSWDGTMFEALMVPLFVPEAEWSPGSWGMNHRLYTRAQIDYGLVDAKLGYWGISASTNARGGYHAFGVGPLGLNSSAGRCPDGSIPRVVTPHASFLALPYAPREAIDNLKALSASFPVYGPYGFLDAVDIKTGRVSDGVLMLDQGMILAAIANALGQDVLQQAFSTGMIETALRPLMAAEQFEVGPKLPASSGRDRKPGRKPAMTVLTPPAEEPADAIVAAPTVDVDRDDVSLPFLLDARVDAVNAKRSPARRKPGKSGERRRAVG